MVVTESLLSVDLKIQKPFSSARDPVIFSMKNLCRISNTARFPLSCFSWNTTEVSNICVFSAKEHISSNGTGSNVPKIAVCWAQLNVNGKRMAKNGNFLELIGVVTPARLLLL